MDAVQFAILSINDALDYVDLAIGEIDDEQYNWQPPGTCNNIAKLHVHATSGADFFINHLICGEPPLWIQHAGRLGVPALPADLWPSAVRIERVGIDAYVAQMREAVNARLQTLTDDVFSRDIDTPMAGRQTGAWVLRTATTHTSAHAGEISAIKGMQGLKGLPF
jgi:hypothetical protein